MWPFPLSSCCMYTHKDILIFASIPPLRWPFNSNTLLHFLFQVSTLQWCLVLFPLFDYFLFLSKNCRILSWVTFSMLVNDHVVSMFTLHRQHAPTHPHLCDTLVLVWGIMNWYILDKYSIFFLISTGFTNYICTGQWYTETKQKNIIDFFLLLCNTSLHQQDDEWCRHPSYVNKNTPSTVQIFAKTSTWNTFHPYFPSLTYKSSSGTGKVEPSKVPPPLPPPQCLPPVPPRGSLCSRKSYLSSGPRAFSQWLL